MDEPNKFKIGYFADGIWSHNAFKLINNDENFEIKFICPRFDTKDEVLKGFSEKYNIDYIKTKNVNSPDFMEQIKKYNCDILVSMSFNQIFKEEIINLTKCKIINCHAGKLPFYRGRNILNWVLINDEKEFGITVHYVDIGIDTGDIILQKTYSISDSDSYETLLNKAHTECADLLHQALILIKNDGVKKIKQSSIHFIGSYCKPRKEGDEIINWNMTTRELFNFIRAICKPGPMAKCKLKGKDFFINSSEIIKDEIDYNGVSGEIIFKENNALIVKTKDSVIKLIQFFYDGEVNAGDKLE